MARRSAGHAYDSSSRARGPPSQSVRSNAQRANESRVADAGRLSKVDGVGRADGLCTSRDGRSAGSKTLWRRERLPSVEPRRRSRDHRPRSRGPFPANRPHDDLRGGERVPPGRGGVFTACPRRTSTPHERTSHRDGAGTRNVGPVPPDPPSLHPVPRPSPGGERLPSRRHCAIVRPCRVTQSRPSIFGIRA